MYLESYYIIITKLREILININKHVIAQMICSDFGTDTRITKIYYE